MPGAPCAPEVSCWRADASLTGANENGGALIPIDPAATSVFLDKPAFAFGGAGPLHAVALAKELNVPKVLIPARPGITNALGCVVADLRHDFVRTLNRPLDTVDMADVHGVLAAQEAEGRRLARFTTTGPRYAGATWQTTAAALDQ